MARVKTQTLDRRIAILRRGSPSDDGYATAPGVLKRLCWRFASIKPVIRREWLEAGEVRGMAEQSAWLRFDATTRTIVATDLVAMAGKVFSIVGLREVGRSEGVELLLVSADDIASVDPAALSQWT